MFIIDTTSKLVKSKPVKYIANRYNEKVKQQRSELEVLYNTSNFSTGRIAVDNKNLVTAFNTYVTYKFTNVIKPYLGFVENVLPVSSGTLTRYTNYTLPVVGATTWIGSHVLGFLDKHGLYDASKVQAENLWIIGAHIKNVRNGVLDIVSNVFVIALIFGYLLFVGIMSYICEQIVSISSKTTFISRYIRAFRLHKIHQYLLNRKILTWILIMLCVLGVMNLVMMEVSLNVQISSVIDNSLVKMKKVDIIQKKNYNSKKLLNDLNLSKKEKQATEVFNRYYENVSANKKLIDYLSNTNNNNINFNDLVVNTLKKDMNDIDNLSLISQAKVLLSIVYNSRMRCERLLIPYYQNIVVKKQDIKDKYEKKIEEKKEEIQQQIALQIEPIQTNIDESQRQIANIEANKEQIIINVVQEIAKEAVSEVQSEFDKSLLSEERLQKASEEVLREQILPLLRDQEKQLINNLNTAKSDYIMRHSNPTKIHKNMEIINQISLTNTELNKEIYKLNSEDKVKELEKVDKKFIVERLWIEGGVDRRLDGTVRTDPGHYKYIIKDEKGYELAKEKVEEEYKRKEYDLRMIYVDKIKQFESLIDKRYPSKISNDSFEEMFKLQHHSSLSSKILSQIDNELKDVQKAIYNVNKLIYKVDDRNKLIKPLIKASIEVHELENSSLNSWELLNQYKINQIELGLNLYNKMRKDGRLQDFNLFIRNLPWYKRLYAGSELPDKDIILDIKITTNKYDEYINKKMKYSDYQIIRKLIDWSLYEAFDIKNRGQQILKLTDVEYEGLYKLSQQIKNTNEQCDNNYKELANSLPLNPNSGVLNLAS